MGDGSKLMVDLLTPKKRVLKEFVTKGVIIPGEMGFIEVLPGHTALITEIGSGGLVIKTEQDEMRYYADGGYAEVKGEHLILVLDRLVEEDKIDPETAKNAFW